MRVCWFDRDAADRVVQGSGKYEELVVCSQEIAASTAQLVVASKVKAHRDSENLAHLSDASKGVTTATGLVVASAKSGAERIEEMGALSVIDVTANGSSSSNNDRHSMYTTCSW